MPHEDAAAGYPIESVDRALRLLVLLAEHGPLSVSDAAAQLGVARSTAHRLLTTLLAAGFARQDPDTRLYRSGERLLQIGGAGLLERDVRPLAHPHLEALRRELDETISLVLLDGADVVFLDAVESQSALRVGSRAGQSLPAHCTAAGKAMLAGLTQQQLDARLGSGPLRQLTETSIGDRAALEAELEHTRTRGYAVSVDESERGITAVAVPIAVSAPARPLALGASVPSGRLDDARLATLAAALGEHAQALAEQLRG